MNIVREHINEKFTQDSDPVSDLGIGYGKWRSLNLGDAIVCKHHVILNDTYELHVDDWCFVCSLPKIKNDTLIISVIPFAKKPDDGWISNVVDSCKSGKGYGRWDNISDKISNFNKNFEIIKVEEMLKESLNEKFREESDPIKDLNIGLRQKLYDYAKKLGYFEKSLKNPDINILSAILTDCCDRGENILAEYVLSLGANVEGPSYHSAGSPLRWALFRNNKYLVELLLKNGADVHNATSSWWWGEHKAAIDPEIIKIVEKARKKAERKKINEKFTKDSDPIHDLGIGGKPINITKKRDQYRKKYKNDWENGRYIWGRKIEKICVGKKIYGRFNNIKNPPVSVMCDRLLSESFGETIEIITKDKKSFKVLEDETYLIQ